MLLPTKPGPERRKRARSWTPSRAQAPSCGGGWGHWGGTEGGTSSPSAALAKIATYRNYRRLLSAIRSLVLAWGTSLPMIRPHGKGPAFGLAERGHWHATGALYRPVPLGFCRGFSFPTPFRCVLNECGQKTPEDIVPKQQVAQFGKLARKNELRWS